MKILDCENTESIYKLLEIIFDTPAIEIKNFLLNTYLDASYAIEPKPLYPIYDLLYRLFTERFNQLLHKSFLCHS